MPCISPRCGELDADMRHPVDVEIAEMSMWSAPGETHLDESHEDVDVVDQRRTGGLEGGA
jgi:hypothetical protein